MNTSSNNSLPASFFLSLFLPLLCVHVSAQAESASEWEQDGGIRGRSGSRAGLISVPLQNNTNLGVGPFERNQNVLNIEPVIPFHLSESWNLIIRWIVPIISQPAPGTANLEVLGIEENTPTYLAAQSVQESAGVLSFGDVTPTFFVSPSKPHRLIWGAGPVFILPTATSKVLGQGKLSVGHSFVALLQPGTGRS